MRKESAPALIAIAGICVSSAVILVMLFRATALSDGAEGSFLPESGWFVLVAGVACLVICIAMLAYSRFLTPSLVTPQPPADASIDGATAVANVVSPPLAEFDMSRLREDERRLYEMIADKGGEAFQRDLVASGEFSKAKVTRLLDKLEGKELIKRERHGMTNKVKLVR